ncbi:MAG: hypothetical protein U0821_13995 [Chloroflexota bacterium]
MWFRRGATMITWAPYSGRSEGLAQSLGINNHFVHFLSFQRPWLAPLKYPLQAIVTLAILLRERPALVLCQNPPFVAPLVAWLYCALSGARLAIDSHSQAYIVRRWRWSLPIQRWLSRRAAATIVTNEHLASGIRAWDAPVLIAPDPPVRMPELGPRLAPATPTVVVINTYAEDEPVAEVIAAARTLPHVHFALTGNPKYAQPEWLANLPPNVELTGFLPMDDYYRRIRDASVLMALTTLDHTVQRGGWEALDLGQPLIVSDWPILREYFRGGTLHTANDSDSIARAVSDALAHESTLRQDMLVFRDERRREWQRAQASIERLIPAQAPPRSPLRGAIEQPRQA